MPIGETNCSPVFLNRILVILSVSEEFSVPPSYHCQGNLRPPECHPEGIKMRVSRRILGCTPYLTPTVRSLSSISQA